MARDYELDRLRDEMNGAWESMQYAKRELDRAWDDVQSLQSRYGYQIDRLKDEHDRTFEAMKDAFEDASRAFERGDHGNARSYADRGKELKAELPGLVSERRAVIEELQRVRANHRAHRDVYHDKKREWQLAKERFDDRKAMHQAAKQDAVFRAGLQHYGHDVLVKHREDGKTDIYFGGLGRPDGPGHAHYILDQFGNIEHRRDPFQDKGPQHNR